MPVDRMHADELVTDEALVRRLLEAQFPAWAELPIEVLPAGGTENAIFRLGDELSVRLPRRRDWAPGSLDKEFEWLPKLAQLLPLSVPTPVARGAPGEGYPHEWAVYNWLDGEGCSLPPAATCPRTASTLPCTGRSRSDAETRSATTGSSSSPRKGEALSHDELMILTGAGAETVQSAP